MPAPSGQISPPGASWEIEAPTTRVARDPLRQAAAIEPTTGQARQVLSHRLHELGLSGRKLAKVDKLRRNVHLGVCGPRRVVPGVMHGPTGDATASLMSLALCSPTSATRPGSRRGSS